MASLGTLQGSMEYIEKREYSSSKKGIANSSEPPHRDNQDGGKTPSLPGCRPE